MNYIRGRLNTMTRTKVKTMGVNLPNTDWNPVVRIVEDDFDKSGDDALSSSLMKQRLSLLLTHVTELIRQHKLYR